MTDDMYWADPCALVGSPSWCTAIFLYTRRDPTSCRTALYAYSTITICNYFLNLKEKNNCTVHYTNSAVKQFYYISQHKCVDFLYGKAQNSVQLNIFNDGTAFEQICVCCVWYTDGTKNYCTTQCKAEAFFLLRIFSFHVF